MLGNVKTIVNKKTLFTMSEFLKSMGVEIKSFEKGVSYVENDGTRHISGIFHLKDGRKMNYLFERTGNNTTQKFKLGSLLDNNQQEIKIFTTRFPSWANDVNGKNVPATVKKGCVTRMKADANGQLHNPITDAFVYREIPVEAGRLRKNANGEFYENIGFSTELHSDRMLGNGKFVSPTDIRYNPDGTRLPIYERPLYLASKGISLKRLSDNYGQLRIY